MRTLYNEWLDSGKQTYTASGNVRAPSRTDICDMVAQAWSEISEEMIAKSFVCCGQSKTQSPEDITCLKEGHVAAPALEEVKKFWENTASQFEEVPTSTQTLEVDEEEDICIFESDDE